MRKRMNGKTKPFTSYAYNNTASMKQVYINRGQEKKKGKKKNFVHHNTQTKQAYMDRAQEEKKEME